LPKNATCSGTPRKGDPEGWRQRLKREKDRLRKAKEKKRKNRPHGGGESDCKSVLSPAIIRSTKTLQKQGKDAVRKYSIHKVPGAHLTFDQRERLAADWNRLVRRGPMPTMRGFARAHGLALATWSREFNRGRTGVTVRDLKHPGRWIYSEYDPGKAQDAVNSAAANKGAPMKVTNMMAETFAKLVKEEKRSPFDAVQIMRTKFRKGTPCARTWYYHIAHGDLSVKYGETPYHPSKKKRKGPKPHPAKTVPGRLQMKDRPKEANDRSEPGHLEMDTIVSCLGGMGGLLVLIDRCTREYFVELLESISQDAVMRALKQMKRRGLLKDVKSVTADNGCEFLDPEAMKVVFGCDVCYTRAYASWEKGSVENCNRIVRRWYPKGTDFSLCTRADIHRLETVINSIHRMSLGGMSAHDFAETKRRAA
jgi:IS30 family transposase